jgi:hypothetical protein
VHSEHGLHRVPASGHSRVCQGCGAGKVTRGSRQTYGVVPRPGECPASRTPVTQGGCLGVAHRLCLQQQLPVAFAGLCTPACRVLLLLVAAHPVWCGVVLCGELCYASEVRCGVVFPLGWAPWLGAHQVSSLTRHYKLHGGPADTPAEDASRKFVTALLSGGGRQVRGGPCAFTLSHR